MTRGAQHAAKRAAAAMLVLVPVAGNRCREFLEVIWIFDPSESHADGISPDFGCDGTD